MTNRDIKERFLQRLKNRDVWYKKQTETEYVTRCPFCGDSDNPTHGHLYIYINLDDNSPIKYHCFKCPAGGYLDKDVCIRLGIDNLDTLTEITALNKYADKEDKKQIMGDKFHIFDFHLPEMFYNPKMKYIENRLGRNFLLEEYRKMKCIPSFYQFIQENNIESLMCSEDIAYMFEKNYIGFLSYGNSHILFRDVTEKMKYKWIKYPICKRSKDNKIFYSISSKIDIFSENTITVNLCEGVLDAVSICFNLGFDTENTLTIAVTGKYYEPIIRYLIGLGIFGNNVVLNIFADNDADFNKKNTQHDTDIDFYRNLFKNTKYIFKRIKVFYNIKRKDCGYPLDEILLKDYNV